MTLKLNIRVESRVSERLKTQNLQKIGCFKEILKCSWNPEILKPTIQNCQKSAAISVLQNCQKSAVRHFIEKPMLFTIVDLSKPKVVLLLNFFAMTKVLFLERKLGTRLSLHQILRLAYLLRLTYETYIIFHNFLRS